MENSPSREIKMVGHPIKVRDLEVLRTRAVSPKLVEIVLGGESLSDFVSLSPDDHIKAFFAPPGEKEFAVPALGADGLQFPEGKPKPVMRDYTPVSYDNARKELTLQFFLHEGGAGASWAREAKPGSKLVIAGPRGSRIVPHSFDWYLLIGDESSLPSFTRRLREMSQETRGIVIFEVESASDEILLETPPGVTVHWVHRNGAPASDASRLRSLIDRVGLFAGDYFAWVSGESECVKNVAEHLLTTKGARKEWMKATAYWHA